MGMPPILPPDDDPDRNRRVKLALVAGLAMVFAMGLVMFVGPDTTERTLIPMLFSLLVVLGVLGVVLRAAVARPETGEKRKRAGVDMYTLIDRLVDDLDEDEAAYLRQRLDDRERGLDTRPLQEALADTLERRDEDRRLGFR